MAEQLAAETNFQLIALASAESDADVLRHCFLDPAAPVGQLSIVAGQLEHAALPKYLADLIVAEDWEATGLHIGKKFLLSLFERLRPMGALPA